MFKCVSLPGTMWVKDANHFCSHSKNRHDASNEHALDWLLAFVFVSKDAFQSADSIKAPLKDKTNPICGLTCLLLTDTFCALFLYT